ncbi:MAG: serine/threonine-protein kinase [Myxococcota bacterium]
MTTAPTGCGAYEILGVLGEGAMGVVYRAHDRATGRHAALKIIEPHPELGIPEPELRGRFRREVEMLRRVRSPRVVEIYESGELDDGRMWLAMELAPGTALDTMLTTHGPLPPKRVMAIGLDVAEALAEVHRAGMVHRDVKPGNVVVAPRGDGSDSAKLVDFGVARALVGAAGKSSERLTMTGMVLGSLGYMAPEQSGGASDPSPTIDVYALGVTLFELATGRLPFEGPTAAAFAMQHRQSPVPRLAKILGETRDVLALEAVVLRAMAKDPLVRQSDGGSLAREIAAALQIDPAVRATADRVKARVAEVAREADVAAPRARRRLTPGRVAAALAAMLAIATMVWGVIKP